MLRMCLNPKVIAGLAVVAAGVYLVAPNLIAAALPLLILAVCPVSMLLMGRAMMGGHGAMEGTQAPSAHQKASAPDDSDEEVGALRAQVQSMSDQQAALIEELRRLRQENSTGARTALEEAEEIARAIERD